MWHIAWRIRKHDWKSYHLLVSMVKTNLAIPHFLDYAKSSVPLSIDTHMYLFLSCSKRFYHGKHWCTIILYLLYHVQISEFFQYYTMYTISEHYFSLLQNQHPVKDHKTICTVNTANRHIYTPSCTVKADDDTNIPQANEKMRHLNENKDLSDFL